MRVRISLDVDAFQRLVIASYYGGQATRATRAQVRRYAKAAVETMAHDWVPTLRSRRRGAALRLLDLRAAARAELGADARPETIDAAAPRQMALF